MDSGKWNEYWERPYTRYEGHQQWFWDTAYPFIIPPVLDLGVGSASMWRGKDDEVVGIDYSASAIEEAKKNYPKGEFSVADITTYTPDRTFSTVCSFGVIHYFLPDKLEQIKKVHTQFATKRIVFSLNTPVDLNLFKDWGKLLFAEFRDRQGWVIALDVE